MAYQIQQGRSGILIWFCGISRVSEVSLKRKARIVLFNTMSPPLEMYDFMWFYCYTGCLSLFHLSPRVILKYIHLCYYLTFPSRLLTMCTRHFGSVVAQTIRTYKTDQFPLLLIVMGKRTSNEVLNVIQGNCTSDNAEQLLMQEWQIIF